MSSSWCENFCTQTKMDSSFSEMYTIVFSSTKPSCWNNDFVSWSYFPIKGFQCSSLRSVQCVFFPSLLLQRSETACLHNLSVLSWNLSRLRVLDVSDDTPKRALFLTYTPLLLVQAVTCLKMNKKSVGGENCNLQCWWRKIKDSYGFMV